MVFLPFVVLSAAQIGWLADVLERTELRAIAVETARFAALADVTPDQANAHLAYELGSFLNTAGVIDFGSKIRVLISFPSHEILNINFSQIEVVAISQPELSKS